MHVFRRPVLFYCPNNNGSLLHDEREIIIMLNFTDFVFDGSDSILSSPVHVLRQVGVFDVWRMI